MLCFQKEEATGFPFGSFYFHCGVCPVVTFSKMYNVKPSESSYISREDNKKALLILVWRKLLRTCVLSSWAQSLTDQYMFLLSLYRCIGQGEVLNFSHRFNFSVNITDTTNILTWFTMASLELTTETECEDP